jgi:hypothetical protein
MHILFANTGVQVICIPLQSGRRYTTAQIGYGWQHCRCRPEHAEEDRDEDEEPEVDTYPYIQWQIIQSHISKLFLAVDTSLGDPDIGYFSDPSSLAGDFHVRLPNLLDRSGQPLPGLPAIELCLRAATATAGEAKPVHIVVDFGNSRTGALLVEMAGEVAQSAEMLPFELVNRYSLDHFNDEGEQVGKPGSRWFSSKTRWANTPYPEPLEMAKKEYYREMKKGLFGGKKQVKRERETYVRPPLFDDWSMVRMGREVDEVSQIMHAKGDFRTGVSSPKRYLWADDDSWLEGAFWYMADPHDRQGNSEFASKLHGPLLKFIHEDDRDFLIEKNDPPEEAFAQMVPTKPTHAPRCLMTTAIYELLCQAFAYVNSYGYRSRTDDSARTREIHSLTMTFPSGMFQEEKERFQRQCQKAINIYARTVGKHQRIKPQLTFSIDEASAVHLTYIWAELRMLGQDPRLWFAALARDHSRSKSDPWGDTAGSSVKEAVGAMPAARRRGAAAPSRGVARPGRGGPSAEEPAEEQKRKELRIACIDIGGGTSDMMIASYLYEPGIDDTIRGKVLHQDGVSIAGDQLVKRLLERIIVPHFAQAIGLEDEDVLLLFGPRVPKNRGFTSQRVDWINRLFVPLAEAYLQAAVDEVENPEAHDAALEITHTDPELIDPAVLESLEQVCTKLRGPGYYDLNQDLGLQFNRPSFEQVVHEVFDDLLFDFCTRIAEYQADVVLLAGQPSKLRYIQQLISKYLPLPPTRIISMFNHYAGNWYPYQDVKGSRPGLIVDPKSAVVVGAAIEFMARNGMLPQFKFSMQGKDRENSYYWGVMTESTSTIRKERVLFHPVEEGATKDEWTEFTTIALRAVIGRKMSGDEYAQATPIYLLKMETNDRIGPTEVTVRIRRVPASDESDEHLEIDSVSGTVAGQPAVQDENVFFHWRTLADESYFLDTGGLDNIEIGNR